VTDLGDLYVWGAGSQGRLGLGDLEDRRVPTRVQAGWDGSSVRMVSCGGTHDDAHTLAVTQAGAVWSWGANASGQLGLGDLAARTAPTRVPPAAFGGATMVVVANANGAMSMAVSREDLLYTWGRGALAHGALAEVASRSPRPVATSLPRGSRCAPGCGLSRLASLAFAMGSHARHGAETHQVPDDVVARIVQEAEDYPGAYGWMREGQLRLLGWNARVP